MPNSFYIVIGDGEDLINVKKYAKNLKIEKNVIFAGAIYEEINLAPYFLISDIFLYPGYIGLSLVHAQWYGLPVITHNNHLRHAPEFSLLIDNFNSIQYIEHNQNDLNNKLYLLFKDRDKIDAMKKNSIKHVQQNWTFSNSVKNYINAIKSIDSIN